MSSVLMLVFVDYSFLNEQRLPYSLRRSPVSAQPFQSPDTLLNGLQLFLQDNLLGWMRQNQFCEPAKVLLRPVGSAFITYVVAK